MAHSPLVSCIMIFLNAEKFMTEAIASVFAQTYEHWELVLVDDGSHDRSTAIARQYAKQYPARVRYLEHPGHQNRGMSASRNLGIREARGAYVAFLDADDLWLPGKLAQQVAILNAQPEAAMVYGQALIWYGWTGNPEDLRRDHTFDLGVPPNKLVQPPTLFFLLLQNKVQTPITSNVMLRRSVFDTIGRFEERFRGMYEDQAFFAKVHLKAATFVADARWAKYRQHPESCSVTSTHMADYYATRLPFLTWLARYLSAEGFNRNTKVWQALQRELWVCQHPHWHRLRTFPRRMLGRTQSLLGNVTLVPRW
jgi:glycosyltransferase involved in cell wall biosynthesis